MVTEPVRTLADVFFRNVTSYRRNPLLIWKRHGQMIRYSTAEFESAVLKLAGWFESLGLEKGDRVAICAENRPEWHIVDFAAHLADLPLVPVYSTLAAHQMEHILAHSGARVMFCGDEQMERLATVRANLPALEHLVALDATGAQASLAAILQLAPEPDETTRAHWREKTSAIDPEEIATIVYTSGTTGDPKGVMLSHGNIVFNFASARERLPDRIARQALSVLPLSHVFERVLAYAYFSEGIPLAYGDPHDLKQLLLLYRPQIIGVVPRILEKMRDAIEAKIAHMPVHRQKIAKFLLSAGYAKLAGNNGWRAKLYPVAEALMFRKIHDQLGNVEVFVSGGAWLNPELERYFRAIGFVILQGYGLTETSPVIACNEFGAEKIGCVGRPIRGAEVQLSADGEIMTRGPHVMKGYFNNPEGTAKVLNDGWFYTGDLGRIDEGGFLTITGRRKEMLVLSNGKNIYYAPIEKALEHSRFIEHAFVVGEGRNYTAAILIANMPAVLQYASEKGIEAGAPYELLLKPPILQLFREEIDLQQADFSRFEQTKRFCFMREEALLDLDLVTPTQKVRRAVLDRKYGTYIDQIYRQEQPFMIPALTETPAPVH
jgi:long-chain acyl-CoA synthetase